MSRWNFSICSVFFLTSVRSLSTDSNDWFSCLLVSLCPTSIWFMWSWSLCNPENTMFAISTLKVPSKICSRWHSTYLFFFFFFSEKLSLGISCESSAKQMIHMKCQDLLSLEKKNQTFGCGSLIGSLSVKETCAWNVKSSFLGKMRKISPICCLLNLLIVW